ncbi:MAG: flavin reductase family protein [Elusimicrobiota bacterium]
MNNGYMEIALDKAYRLLNHGPLVLISTRSEKGNYDIAPIAWNCPVRKSPTRVLAAVGKSHKTHKNIEETGEFIACVPNTGQADLARDVGSVSGDEYNKFEKFNINSIKGNRVNAKIPVGILGYIECKVHKKLSIEGISLIIGEAIYAAALREGFKERVWPENKEGRSLHHLGSGNFGIISGNVDKN